MTMVSISHHSISVEILPGDSGRLIAGPAVPHGLHDTHVKYGLGVVFGRAFATHQLTALPAVVAALYQGEAAITNHAVL